MFDGDEIARLYCVATVTVRGDGSIHCLQSREELARFFQGVLDTYKSHGQAGTTMHDLMVVPIGDRSALVSMTWKAVDADGRPIREWRQSYNLVCLADGWRILVSTFHLSVAPG